MDNREKNDWSVNEKTASDKSAVEKKVFSYMEKHRMLAPGDRVVLGVSGGADSVCLFLLLLEYRKQMTLSLEVVHVNHGIRAEAAEDAGYVEELCREKGVPFSLVEADVRELALREGYSEEDAGRRVRYDAFYCAAKRMGGAKIAVAHNSNDNAETMLFHLFRGSGLQGLGGIAPVRGSIIRPVLCLERWEIEAYLRSVSIHWCQDSTNEKDDYRRNRIRHHILPYAEAEVAAGAVGHMRRTAELLREMEDYLEQQTREGMEKCVRAFSRGDDMAGEVQKSAFGRGYGETGTSEKREMFRVHGTVGDVESRTLFWNDGMAGDTAARQGINGFQIEAACFMKQHAILQKRILFQLLKRLSPTGKDISSIHVMDTLALFEKEGNRSISLPFGIRAWRQYASVFLACGKTAHPTAEKMSMAVSLTDEIFHTPLVYSPGDWGKIEFMGFFIKKGQEVPQKQYTKWFDYDKIKEYVEIRSRRQGDYLMIEDGEGALRHKSLKDYMVTEKIPRQIRDAIPLVAEGSHVLWLPGWRISAAYKVDGNTERVLQVRLLGHNLDEEDETEEKNGGAH